VRDGWQDRVRIWGIAALAAVSFVALTVAALYRTDLSSRVDRELCKQTIENRDAIRATWNTAREVFIARGASEEQINALFDEVLRPIPPLTCVDNKPVPKEG
jgi:hypothetical protein